MDTGLVPLGENALRAVLAHVLALGDAAETNYLEVKSDLDLTATAGLAKVAKFLLGMANRTVADAGRHFQGYAVLVLGATLGATPGVARDLETHELANKLRAYLGSGFPGYDFARIPVGPDRDILFVIVTPPKPGQGPFPCHKDFQGQKGQTSLADGAIYVRTHSETRPAKADEVLALLDRFRAAAPEPPSSEHYSEHAAEAWAGNRLVEKIRTRGHWVIDIRPESFDIDRVAYRLLEKTVADATVQLSGWPMPFMDHGRELLRGADWIGTDIEPPPDGRYETWRFFTNGAFSQVTAVPTDWGLRLAGSEPPPGFTSSVTAWDTVSLATEAYELAALLAPAVAHGDLMRVELRLHGLAGRTLLDGRLGRSFMLPFNPPHGESLGHVSTHSPSELSESRHGLAVTACEELFSRFGWIPQRATIDNIQNEVLRTGSF